jgi:hypothetical protein
MLETVRRGGWKSLAGERLTPGPAWGLAITECGEVGIVDRRPMGTGCHLQLRCA